MFRTQKDMKHRRVLSEFHTSRAGWEKKSLPKRFEEGAEERHNEFFNSNFKGRPKHYQVFSRYSQYLSWDRLWYAKCTNEWKSRKVVTAREALKEHQQYEDEWWWEYYDEDDYIDFAFDMDSYFYETEWTTEWGDEHGNDLNPYAMYILNNGA